MLAGSGSVGMAGLLGHEWGFSRSVRKAPVFYGLVALGTLGGTVLSLLHVNPIHLLVLVAVINGVAAAPFLVVVMWVSSSERLMGDYVNGKAAKILGWLTATVMAAAAVAMFATGRQLLTDSGERAFSQTSNRTKAGLRRPLQTHTPRVYSVARRVRAQRQGPRRSAKESSHRGRDS